MTGEKADFLLHSMVGVLPPSARLTIIISLLSTSLKSGDDEKLIEKCRQHAKELEKYGLIHSSQGTVQLAEIAKELSKIKPMIEKLLKVAEQAVENGESEKIVETKSNENEKSDTNVLKGL